jgi:subtilisin family serine protease
MRYPGNLRAGSGNDSISTPESSATDSLGIREVREMKRFRFILMALIATLALTAQPTAAQTRLVVRDTLGLTGLKTTCLLLKCSVIGAVGDPNNQVFVVQSPINLSVLSFIGKLNLQLGIVSVELDQVGRLLGTSGSQIPAELYDRTPVWYYNSYVWHGYLSQVPNQLIRTADTQSKFGVSGDGIVAIIDTGVDTSHPVLKPVLVSGYDFTRNTNGGNEKGDVTQSTAAVLDGAEPAYVNQSTAAVLDQSTAAVLDNPDYAAFGHGTMTAGVVHLVAPTAKIMPLKAFGPDGAGYVSDVMRAVYYAQKNGAKIISMSFSFPTASNELTNALNSVSSKGLILVASAGNDGKKITVYPASNDNVIGVGSTDDNDQQSSFSNYGTQVVWMAAPGEGVVTTYPYGTYAAAWGTSFSAPFVAGTAALLLDVSTTANEAKAESSLSHADWISTDMGKGRLNTYTAVSAWRTTLGMR